ncbi:MAG: prolipoprotein diacylglyceryl transferase [Deltaproteobacteria bacterium]|nr:prolipoprotein diacylglyceryl transferase [Deltaproteobacteria bacterium]
MRPQLYRLFGEIAFPSYFVLLVAGFMFATAIGALWARRIGRDPDVIIDLGLAMLLAGVAGARIAHVLFDGYFWDYVHVCTNPSLVDWNITKDACLKPPDPPGWLDFGCSQGSGARAVWDEARKVCHPTQTNCFAWAEFWAGGLTYYGGFIGASIAAWFLLKRDRFPFWKAADMAGFAIATGLGFGRMGCLLAGCCFGLRNDGILGLRFPGGSPASESQFKQHLLTSMKETSLPVLPMQIAESALSFAIAGFCLIWLHPRKRYDGHVFVWFVILYAVVRFLLEFLRADDRGGLAGLSTSQWIGLGLVAFAVWLHRRLSSRRGLASSSPAV